MVLGNTFRTQEDANKNSLDYVILFSKISEIASIIVFSTGLIALVVWILRFFYSQTLCCKYEMMRVNAAIAFILTGISLWSLQTKRHKMKLSFICAFFTFLIGFLTVIEYVFNINLGLEIFMWRGENYLNGVYNNRIAFSTALNFMLIGTSLMLVDIKTKKMFTISQLFIAFTGIITILSLEGYIYNVSSLYAVHDSITMPMDALFTFFIVFVGMLLVRPDKGFMKTVTSDTIGGLITRRMLITVISIPTVFDIIGGLGVHFGLLTDPFSDAVTMIFTMIALVYIVIKNSILINSEEIKRREAEELTESVARFPNENPNPVFRINNVREIIYANKASRGLLPLFSTKKDDAFEITDNMWKQRINNALSNNILEEIEIMEGNKNFHFTIAPLQEKHYINIYGYDISNRVRAEELLRISENKYRTLVEQASDGIMLSDLSGNYIDCNTKASEMLGYTIDEILKLNVREIIEPDNLTKNPIRFDLLRTGETIMTERRLIRKDRTVFDVEISAKMLNNSIFQAIIRDITERKVMEATLEFERKKLLNIMDTMHDGIYIIDNKFNLQYANPTIIREFGNFKDNKCFSYFHQLGGACPWCKNIEVFQGKTVHWEFTMAKSKKTYDVIDTPLNNPDGSVSKLMILRDITERKAMEEKLKKSIHEKELLLKEMHHRVKNNLQLISGLLGLQFMQIEDETYRAIFEESQNRIKTIAMIHERLYSSKSLVDVNMKEYIFNLITSLNSSFADKNKEVLLNLDMENICVGIDVAIPSGLIINEIFTNILKHAFIGKEICQVNITLKLKNDNEIELSIGDNGIGLPENLDLINPKSLGLTIITILVKQLDAVLEVDRTNGTKYTIRLKFDDSVTCVMER
ncbi:MAG: PAS domain S-box protein [Nitrospirae bacterium]|nr:PAS domain S-box protein [Nitrospirota bacterium]